MKTFITSILLIGLAGQVSANTFFDQLCEFNPNWKKYETRITPKENIHFASEVEYIQAHLTSVITILSSNSTEQLSASQLKSRQHLIEVLDNYRAAGRFPINYYRRERIPVFIDEHNTHCAVGFLMKESGFGELANAISDQDNYVWVKDIKNANAIAWQEMSGFTMEELKIIQGAYDFYMPNAMIAPNRYEIPQKPACTIAYFENENTGEGLVRQPENVWFYGEGNKGVLNGRWEQNYAVGIPWIVGYYKDGKRTGQWKEYYQGTALLCRTENWRDDKLNGVRIRFDREGEIIEEILFKNGDAVTKTNYDRSQRTKSVRTPLDSTLVYTETFTFEGRLLSAGNERVHNPGNLLWFQNIELTALNMVSVSARDVQSEGLQLSRGNNGPIVHSLSRNLFQSPPLVEYKKEGRWMYYRDVDQSLFDEYMSLSISNRVEVDFRHYGAELSDLVSFMNEMETKSKLDSVVVHYENNFVLDFFGYSSDEFKHVHFTYYDSDPSTPEIDQFYFINDYYSSMIEYKTNRLKEVGEYNANGYRIGEWKHFDMNQNMYKVEKYLIPHKEEEMVLGKQ